VNTKAGAGGRLRTSEAPLFRRARPSRRITIQMSVKAPEAVRPSIRSEARHFWNAGDAVAHRSSDRVDVSSVVDEPGLGQSRKGLRSPSPDALSAAVERYGNRPHADRSQRLCRVWRCHLPHPKSDMDLLRDPTNAEIRSESRERSPSPEAAAASPIKLASHSGCRDRCLEQSHSGSTPPPQS
jgi:hypothetical protein